ncbi:hypothetical protein DL770_004731 [Monosporascus sp. CRB-9-2]|nr:hypothetical protein DL770_004731 [Monosporascus sp. CRB-9-2]
MLNPSRSTRWKGVATPPPFGIFIPAPSGDWLRLQSWQRPLLRAGKTTTRPWSCSKRLALESACDKFAEGINVVEADACPLPDALDSMAFGASVNLAMSGRVTSQGTRVRLKARGKVTCRFHFHTFGLSSPISPRLRQRTNRINSVTVAPFGRPHFHTYAIRPRQDGCNLGFWYCHAQDFPFGVKKFIALYSSSSEVSMSTLPGQLRPALGHSADLGDFYDGRTDCFIPLSLLAGASPSPKTITITKIESANTVVIAGDTLDEKFTKLGLGNELAASVLAGMVPVSGSGYYLRSSRRSDQYVEGAVLPELTTERMTLDLSRVQETENVSPDVCSTATHAVAGITFGARIVVAARLAAREQSPKASKQLQLKLEELASYIRGRHALKPKSGPVQDYNHEHGKPLHDAPGDLKFAIFSDISNLQHALEGLDLKMTVLDHGGQYTDYTGALSAISTGSNIYVFYFTQTMKQDRDSWNTNYCILLSLLRRKSDYVVVVAECAPGEISFSKSRISFYRRYDKVIEDMREAQDHADQSFAKYDLKSINIDGRPMPIDRQLVKLPCPFGACGNESREWHCYICRQPLEYSNLRFYCDCGHTNVKSFTWQCNSLAHGTQFVQYYPEALRASLLKLESYKEHNILLLGETGVGKSTFINAFYNYMIYRDLDDAMAHGKLEAIIPSSFTIQRIENSPSGRRFIQTDIRVGKNDKFEADGTRGDSATQKTGVYRIPIGDRIIRIIDTPGVGDVRGIDADRKNLDNILQTLSRINSLSGIVILLKPNASRLTLTFRFCIQELLTYLHRDAARNIIWGFTNTRQSNYMPGDSYKPLERLLQQHESLGLSLTPDNVFCFDSESFRCLAAQKQGCVPTENLNDFRRSWERSTEETNRLLQYVSSLQPHSVTGTLCLNRARELISQLTGPIAEVDDKIQWNIKMVKDQLAKVNDAKTRSEVLEQSLHYERVDIELHRLPRPRTVCKSPACVDFKDVGGVKRPIYKSLCHDPCYLNGVTEEIVGHARLIRCSAFAGHSKCLNATCGHHWREHMHMWYSQEEKMVTAVDLEVQSKLQESKSKFEARKTVMQGLEKDLAGHQKELEEIRNAASQFGLFLKRNSITPYNDAMISYLDALIKDEQNLIGFHNSQGDTLPGNKKRLKSLEESKNEYQVRIKALETQMRSSDNIELLDEKGVEDMVKKLYSLPLWGSRLQGMRRMVEWSKAENFREQQFRPKVKKEILASLRPQGDKRTVGNTLQNVGSTVSSALSSGYNAIVGVFRQAPNVPGQESKNHGVKRAPPEDLQPTPPQGHATRSKLRRLSTDISHRRS